MNRSVTLGALLPLFGLVSACGTSSSSTSAHAGGSPNKPKGCLAVSQRLEKNIASGHEAGTQVTPAAAAAFRSPDFTHVYFVAMRYTSSGDTETGIWATNTLTGGAATILAVDGFAKQFTVWPDADKSAAHIDGADPSGDSAVACLRAG